jgi:hypothetical protein
MAKNKLFYFVIIVFLIPFIFAKSDIVLLADNTSIILNNSENSSLGDSLDIKDIIEIENLSYENGEINLTYILDNSDLIGDETSVEIWISNESGDEINRIYDVFSINKDPPIKRDLLIELEPEAGVYIINLALSSDLNNYIKKSIVLGDTKTTGKVILDSPKGKVMSYIIFVLVIAVGIFFIIEKRHGKDKSVNKGGFLMKRA